VPFGQRLQIINPLLDVLDVRIGKHSDFQCNIPLQPGLMAGVRHNLAQPACFEKFGLHQV
jgi:hypothetical protein